MDISAVAINEFHQWLQDNTPRQEDGLYSLEGYFIEVNIEQTNAKDYEIKILKASQEDSEKYITIAKIMEFLKEDEGRLAKGQQDFVDEIRSIIKADTVANEMMQQVVNPKEHQAAVLRIRQYG